jgi:hypothetical protein
LIVTNYLKQSVHWQGVAAVTPSGEAKPQFGPTSSHRPIVTGKWYE